MPEGDTIHRAANRLRPALEGKALTRFEAPRLIGDRPIPGQVIERVEAIGKHLLVHFPKSLVLHTHMMMSGSWHLYRTNERWREPRHLARAVIEVPGWIAVCFAAPVVQTFRDLPGEPTPVSHLGPDLCVAGADFDLIEQRCVVLAEPHHTIAEVLLDQRIACGLGNVYKSEALWACKVHPFSPIGAVAASDRDRLWRTASKQLRSNLQTARRTTVPGGLAVYRRERQPCLRCATTIEMRHHGEQARSTYWCPACQPTPERPESPAEP